MHRQSQIFVKARLTGQIPPLPAPPPPLPAPRTELKKACVMRTATRNLLNIKLDFELNI